MKRLNILIVLGALVCVSASAAFGEADWEKNAKFCVTDKADARARYMDSCKKPGNDQYTAVLACQEHNEQARKTIVEAGKDKVNQLMANVKPSECNK